MKGTGCSEGAPPPVLPVRKPPAEDDAEDMPPAADEGEKVLEPLRSFGSPLADMIAPMPYTQVQRMFDEGFPAGLHNYWKSNFLSGMDDKAIELIVEHVRNAPSPNSAVAIEQFGGAVNRVGINDTEFGQLSGL